MRILFVNCNCGVGSTGRIVTDLMQQAKNQGHTVRVACSTVEPIRGVEPSEVFIVGSKLDYYVHNVLSRITDHEGCFSKIATKRLIKQIKEYDPEVVHLHNLHGHWINYELLFQYLSEGKKKVIWTLHDCWAFTGHCSHFSTLKCEQWKTHCSYCAGLRSYPMCYGKGDVSKNFDRKKKAFTSVQDITLVTPSEWLAGLVKQSFLNPHRIKVIHNKIDMTVFKPTESDFRERYSIENKTVVLGVSNVWSREKGFNDFIRLRGLLDDHFAFVMVGLTQDQLPLLPEGIIGIKRTHSVSELAEIYSVADVFLNLTYQDNYPTVNLEAIACGTPVISYKTGGSCEAFDETSGVVIDQGAVEEIPQAIKKALLLSKKDILLKAEEFYSYGDYLSLFTEQ